MTEKKKKIAPADVFPDRMGSRTREWFVRLPEGMVADDLKDPTIWSRVQSDRGKALLRHDKLYLVDYAESFAVEARVTDVTVISAALALQKIISLGERLMPLFHDEKYSVKWDPRGYFVMRKADQMQMGSHFGSEELAIRHLRSLYPMAVE